VASKEEAGVDAKHIFYLTSSSLGILLNTSFVHITCHTWKLNVCEVDEPMCDASPGAKKRADFY